MYAHTLSRVVKMCKIGKQGVFLVIFTHFGKVMMEN